MQFLLPRKRLSALTVTTLIVGGVFVAAPAHAQFFNNSTGLANPVSTIHFDEFGVPQGSLVTTQYSSLGVTFTNAYQTNERAYGATDAITLGNFSNNGTAFNPLTIRFNNALTSAAFGLATDVGNVTFTALLGGVVVSSTTFNTPDFNSPQNYYGFTGITFDAIQIDASRTQGGPYFDLDNLQLGQAAVTSSVPEPSEYAVGGMFGATLLFGMVKARRKASSKKAPASA